MKKEENKQKNIRYVHSKSNSSMHKATKETCKEPLEKHLKNRKSFHDRASNIKAHLNNNKRANTYISTYIYIYMYLLS